MYIYRRMCRGRWTVDAAEMAVLREAAYRRDVEAGRRGVYIL